jgi:hypothetical protein
LTPNDSVLSGVVARPALRRLSQRSDVVLRGAWTYSRTQLSASVRRVEQKVVSSKLGPASMLVPVFAVVSLMILLLQQFMPAWRAAFTASGIMAVIGVSLLQKDIIAELSTAWLRLKLIGSIVAGREPELIRAHARPRERNVQRG